MTYFIKIAGIFIFENKVWFSKTETAHQEAVQE
jgi:hypothetical protein